jgi:hypothetical protein
MKITGSSSFIKVEIDGKVMKINGEMIVGGFVAFKDSMKSWEPPNENETIDDITKNNIIQKVVEKTKGSHMAITFE